MLARVSTKSTYFAKEGETNMTKLLATLIAAAFFAVSMNSVAVAASAAGDAPKAEANKKSGKTAKAKKPKKAKKAKKTANK